MAPPAEFPEWSRPASVTGIDSGPTVLRIVLGAQLRRLREAGGISRDAAGDAIRASHAKISRLELGRVGLKERDVADLLTLYGVTDAQERAQFLELVQQVNVPEWWQQYGDVLPPWFETYVRLDQASAYCVPSGAVHGTSRRPTDLLRRMLLS